MTAFRSVASAWAMPTLRARSASKAALNLNFRISGNKRNDRVTSMRTDVRSTIVAMVCLFALGAAGCGGGGGAGGETKAPELPKAGPQKVSVQARMAGSSDEQRPAAD